MGKTVFSVREIGETLGICYVKALELTEREDFPCIRIGRRKVIPCDAFHRWLEAQTTPALAAVGTPARRA